MSDQQQVSKTVDASPEQLFSLLAKPALHTDFDGAHMLRGAEPGDEEITGTGDAFVMNMENDALGPYQMRNIVTAYEPNRKIGWAPSLHPLDGYTDKLGDVRATGHTWTWELEPEGSGTKVTQTYDWSGVTDEQFRGFFPMVTEDQMSATIDKVADAAK
jgi:Polyketide cyclase / dehydrase and lipid transport